MLECRVWCENGDLVAVFDDYDEAQEEADTARRTCPCEPDEKCGVIHPHGISIQVIENGEDVTQDYLINHAG